MDSLINVRNQVFRKTNFISSNTIKNTCFIINEKTKILFKLDDSGALIWEKINGKRNISEIITVLQATYSGNEQKIENATFNFLKTLYKEGLITIVKKRKSR